MHTSRIHRVISQLCRLQPGLMMKLPASSTTFQNIHFSHSFRCLSSSQLRSNRDPLLPAQMVGTVGKFTAHNKDAEDPLIKEIIEVENINELTGLVEQNFEKMDRRAVVAIMEVLFPLLRKEKAPKLRETFNSVGMQKFCKALRKHGRHMDSGDILSAVKILTYIGVPASDTTLEILLKLLTKHANSLELHQICYLHFLINKMNEGNKSPLTEALEVALPVVFESQLHEHLESENIQSLCDYLHYASKNNLSHKSIQILVETILKSKDQIGPRHALSIVWSLADLKREGGYEGTLVSLCLKHLADSLDLFKLEELNTTMAKAAKKYMKKVPYFYNEDFVQAFCYKFMSRYINPMHSLWCCRYVSVMKHVNVEFMDRVGEIIASDPSEVLNHDHLFLSLVRSFASTNYKPEKWSKFEAMFLNHPALTKDLGFQDIHLALDFLALDTYPEQLIYSIYSPEEFPRLDVYLQKNPFVSAGVLILLYNAIKILHPQYSGPLPPISMIEKWKDMAKHVNSKKNYLLKNALQTGFGGENYVINGVYHDGLHIDHAIVMRKGGFPIAVNSDSNSDLLHQNGLADIKKPSESVIVLVKVFYKEAYSNNTNRLRGNFALEQKIIERIGHPVVVFDAERWLDLPDHEKIPFLMHRIREKIEKFQWNQSGSDVIPQ